MAEEASILLLESEETVIKDVISSLRLIDIPVLSSPSVADAKRCALEEKPAMVLARLRLQEDQEAGLNLAKDFASHEQLGNIPVVVLCTESEKSTLEDSSGLFDGEIDLPVEFPFFTERVRSILEQLQQHGRQKLKQENGEPQSKQQPLAAVAGAEQAEAALSPEMVLRRNLGVAHGIQLMVMDKLRQGKILYSSKGDEIPKLMATVTAEVCANFDFKKLVK